MVALVVILPNKVAVNQELLCWLVILPFFLYVLSFFAFSLLLCSLSSFLLVYPRPLHRFSSSLPYPSFILPCFSFFSFSFLFQSLSSLFSIFLFVSFLVTPSLFYSFFFSSVFFALFNPFFLCFFFCLSFSPPSSLVSTSGIYKRERGREPTYLV